MATYHARLAEDFKQAEVASQEFEQHYGEFTSFFYRPGFDLFLRKQVLLFWEPSLKDKTFLDTNHWSEKHPFNFPGPFYTGESDTCGTGIAQAPVNVANDMHCCEYIFKQPTSYYELLCVLNAAAVEVFDSYSSNGNDYWTYASCKQWWRNRDGLLRHLTRKEVIDTNDGQAQLYLDYLNGEAEMDLRRYCYFLEHGLYPLKDHTTLPEL
ncbi:MAG: hypothetical protein ACRYFX_22555 [Janthinobacterium lividum]